MTDDITAAERGVVLARTGAEGFSRPIETAGHALVADEPESVGGADTGPSPYEIVTTLA